jgi:hypothetical protein
MGYDAPNFQVRHETLVGNAGGAATTEYAKFRSFQKTKIKAVHAIVTVAGTSTAHGLDVYHGTTSIGTIVVGTAAVGTGVHSATLNEIMQSYDQASVKSLADVVGKADIIVEHNLCEDGTNTP